MNVEYHKWWSPNLNQDMEMKVYGHAGKPVLVFPTKAGKFYEYEDYGMVEVLKPFLDDGRIQLFAVDSMDAQSWLNEGVPMPDRVRRTDQYEAYLTHAVFPASMTRGTWTGTSRAAW